MRRGRVFIYLGLIIILALVAVGILLPRFLGTTPTDNGLVNNVPVEIAPTPEPINVVITTQKIGRGDVLTTDVMKTVQIQREFEIEAMFNNLDEVVGKRSKYDLEAGVYMTSGMVADSIDQLSTTGSNGALLIPPGMVAVSIPINRLSSVSLGLSRGDHVSVIVTLLMVELDAAFQSKLPSVSSAVIAPGPAVVLTQGQGDLSSTQLSSDELLQVLTAQITTGGSVSPMGRVELDPTLGQPFFLVPSESQRPRMVSQSLIQDAVVLQVGNFEVDEPSVLEDAAVPAEEADVLPAVAADTAVVEPAAVVLPDVITLIVSPQDAVTLNYLMYAGAQLNLALRSARDDSQLFTEAVTLQFLLDQYNIPVPAKLPYGLEPRIDTLVQPVLTNDIPVEPTQK